MAERVKPYQDRRRWLLETINSEKSVDVLNSGFVFDYANFTGAKITVPFWGAGWCQLLSSDLRRMFKGRLLRRRTVGLSSGAWQPGFPKWVYSYSLSGIGHEAIAAAQEPSHG